MKPDDFEQQIQRQPLRTVPPEWRESLLRTAQAAAAVCPPQSSTFQRLWVRVLALPWRELFWPCPQAWAGLAAVWIALLILNFGPSETNEPSTAKTHPNRLTPETMMALQEQRRTYTELIGSVKTATPGEKVQPRPRTEHGAENLKA